MVIYIKVMQVPREEWMIGMEIWALYNGDRVKTSKTMNRGDPIPEGFYRLVVHVCIFNSRGEMLIQQRQPFKQGWPDRWDVTVGGSATKDDNSQTAASRELFEELGYRVSFQGVRPRFTVNFERGFDDFYLVEDSRLDIAKLVLQPEEVRQVKWASIDEIFAMKKRHEFIPYHESIIKMCFDMRAGYGSHKIPDTIGRE